MKNFLMCALLICAIPAVAFAQVSVTCTDCTHVVSVYQGSGGIIATAGEDAEGEDAEMVTWVATCGGRTTSGEFEPGDDGVVSSPFSMENGLACNDEGENNSFEIGPVMDGGWFWINDEDNSAVGNLVSKDILDNEDTPITAAGDSLKMMPGKGAVFLKHASGRVGILPNILPVPHMDDVLCGPRQARNFPHGWLGQLTSSCMLGDGGTKIRLQGPAAHGRRGTITGGVVTRPATGDPLVVTADLWLNESGSYSTNTAAVNAEGDPTLGPTVPSIQKGWAGKTATELSAGTGENWLTDVLWSVALHGASPGADPEGAGITLTDASTQQTGDGQVDIMIAPSPEDYCPAMGTQTSATVLVLAGPTTGASGSDFGGVNDIHPPLSRFPRSRGTTLFGKHAVAQLTVMCPPQSAANLGQELVPENPFPPTTE